MTSSTARFVRERVAPPLLWWGGANVIAGLFTWLVPWGVVAGILLQCLFWGVIDAGMGLVALRGKKEIPVEKIGLPARFFVIQGVFLG